MCYKMVLDELAKKIQKIEDEDTNYRENKKWIKYRKQQEDIWDIMIKENEISM